MKLDGLKHIVKNYTTTEITEHTEKEKKDFTDLEDVSKQILSLCAL